MNSTHILKVTLKFDEDQLEEENESELISNACQRVEEILTEDEDLPLYGVYEVIVETSENN